MSQSSMRPSFLIASSPMPSNRIAAAPSMPPRPAGWVTRETAGASAIHALVSPEDIQVVFQPIVNLATGALFAYEALVRCRHMAPPELFERAHELGCVGLLGRVVREIAVPLSTGTAVFLNVHPGELNDQWLVRPDDPLFGHDDDVFLEVTESVPLRHFELCMSVVHELRSHPGVHLVVDDLGAGYSNLKSIADLEPHIVKLDRGLVAGIHGSRRQQVLVQGVVRLCRDLGATVVAEGIETPDEYRAVRDVGAVLGQGYLFARPAFPMPAIGWHPTSLGRE